MSTKIVEYSEKSVAVYGNTKEIKEQLKERGGRFNPRLKEGPGWIFSKKQEGALRDLIEKGVCTPVYSAKVVTVKAPVKPKEGFEEELARYIRQMETQERLAFLSRVTAMCSELPHIKGRVLVYDEIKQESSDEEL
jgi:hypothetical protein